MNSCKRGWISSSDQRYIVRFDQREGGNIMVMDLETETVFKSAVKCPSPGNPFSSSCAVSVSSNMQNELAVFGFVNREFKSPEMEDVQVLPIHVIQMMAKWYCNEQVHLIGSNAGDHHWSMNLDDIVRIRVE